MAETLEQILLTQKPRGIYAADVSSKQAWEILSKEKDAVLIDVRTEPEWFFVGTPDLSSIGKRTLKLSWAVFPSMSQNPDFVKAISESFPDKETKILFLCKTGGRSAAAAEQMASVGYKNCFNVADGFEGQVSENKHRGEVDGWKASKLPWIQN